MEARYHRDPSHEAWLSDWAREHRALPACFDWGGVLALRRDCSVVSVAWDNPDSFREETTCLAHMIAAIGASRD
jgi:hypothetical protein